MRALEADEVLEYAAAAAPALPLLLLFDMFLVKYTHTKLVILTPTPLEKTLTFDNRPIRITPSHHPQNTQ